jgi:hypothetical protein
MYHDHQIVAKTVDVFNQPEGQKVKILSVSYSQFCAEFPLYKQSVYDSTVSIVCAQ